MIQLKIVGDPKNPSNYDFIENYKSGDIVELIGRVDGKNLNNKQGVILSISHESSFCGEIFSPYLLHEIEIWQGATLHVDIENDEDWWITPYNLKNIKYKKNIKKIKNIKIDPFEEEFWGYDEDQS